MFGSSSVRTRAGYARSMDKGKACVGCALETGSKSLCTGYEPTQLCKVSNEGRAADHVEATVTVKRPRRMRDVADLVADPISSQAAPDSSPRSINITPTGVSNPRAGVLPLGSSDGPQFDTSGGLRPKGVRPPLSPIRLSPDSQQGRQPPPSPPAVTSPFTGHVPDLNIPVPGIDQALISDRDAVASRECLSTMAASRRPINLADIVSNRNRDMFVRDLLCRVPPESPHLDRVCVKFVVPMVVSLTVRDVVRDYNQDLPMSTELMSMFMACCQEIYGRLILSGNRKVWPRRVFLVPHWTDQWLGKKSAGAPPQFVSCFAECYLKSYSLGSPGQLSLVHSDRYPPENFGPFSSFRFCRTSGWCYSVVLYELAFQGNAWASLPVLMSCLLFLGLKRQLLLTLVSF